MRKRRTSPTRRRIVGFGATALAAVFAVQLVGVAVAWGNAANPNPDTTGTATVNADGTVTANISGTWSWPGQPCAGRYGEGWAVDWWGISTSQLPANNFSLTNATSVVTPGSTTNATISSVGSVPIKGGTFFHVTKYYAGETVNSATTCTDTGTGPSAASSGSWSASATYPSLSDIPAQVCVNIYDEHGKEGQISKSASDFSPTADHDNSIQTNAFDPTSGMGYCVALKVIQNQTIQGEIFACVNGAPSTTLISGGTLAVPSASLSSSNPLAPTKVAAGSYAVNATAPSGQKFVACGQTGVTINSPTSATQTVTVPAGGAGNAKFYAQAATQTIQGEIFACVNGAPTTTLVSGGTIAVPSAGLSSANPLTPTNVAAGSYGVNATAPSGQKFVACGQTGVTITGTGTATQTVTVPVGGKGDAKFYAQAITYGYVEVCQSNANGVTGSFTFTFAGTTQTVPAGLCGPAVQVPSTSCLTVTQQYRNGFDFVSASTTPSDRLVSVNTSQRSACVSVPPGSVSNQTIVTFVDKIASGTLKVCQAAGSGVPVGTSFQFSVDSAVGVESFSVQAGPAPGGYCFIAGTLSGTVSITQTVPADDVVTSIAVGPSSRQVGSTNLAKGTVSVLIGDGVTEVTYTDAV